MRNRTTSPLAKSVFQVGLVVQFLLTASARASAQSGTAELPRTHKAEPTESTISVRDVMTRTYIIADDSMQGRDTGRNGGLRSAKYIAGELKRLGLEPAGDGGTFLQAIPWLNLRPNTANELNVGPKVYKSPTDFLLIPRVGLQVFLNGQPYGATFSGSNVATVYGGRIGDATIDPNDVKGNVVVFAAAKDNASFAFWQRDNLRRYRDAKAILVAVLDLAPTNNPYRNARDTYWDSTGRAEAKPMSVIAITNAVGDEIFGATLASVAIGTGGKSIGGTVDYVITPTEAPAYNVVGIIRGTDAKLNKSYLAVGMHHDHIGITRPVDHDSIRAFNLVMRERGGDDPPPRQVSEEQWATIRGKIDSLHKLHGGARLDSINNGADDDGSGTVLGLEIAEAMIAKNARPKRSLLFVFHTAEEKGLYGAQYFSDHPTVVRDSIVAQINMDQMGRGDPIDKPAGGTNSIALIGSRRLSTELGDLAETVSNRPAYQFKLDYEFDRNGDPTQGYCRSDHYMYARYGIPVTFFSAAAWHIDYHMVSDEAQYIAYDRMTKIGNYIRDYIEAVANLGHRPLVDKPKPDPLGTCKQ
ncbi:MAG: M20/M25/M40 family metallo-hydrolase [Gemmatimonadaceae bacterium]